MITYDELNIPYLPSGRLWRGFAPPTSFGPLGNSTISQSGNPSFGFYDNFHSFHATSIEGPYRIVEGTGCTVEQIADTTTEKGLIQLAIDGNAANDEAIHDLDLANRGLHRQKIARPARHLPLVFWPQ